jgi:hypothetical protein
MLIAGEWRISDDGIRRPVLRGRVLAAAGPFIDELFLVDLGADRTVLSANLLDKLQLPAVPPATDTGLAGIGGKQPYVVMSTIIEFGSNIGPVHIRGDYAAFTDFIATDMSILGRDVLCHFDVVASQRRNVVLLISGRHCYRVEEE